MTWVNVVVAGVGLLIGADETKGTDSKQIAGPDRSAAEKKELEKVTGTWVLAGEDVPPENAKARPTRLSPEPGSGQQGFAFRRVNDHKSDSPRPVGVQLDAAAIQAEQKRFAGSWTYASVIR